MAVRLKLQVELDVEVLDATILEQAAIARIDALEMYSDNGEDIDAVKAAQKDDVRAGGTEAALIELVDPFDLIPGGSGIECHGSSHGVAVTQDSVTEPAFDDLFEVCFCGQDSCSRCGSFQVTPRSARMLWRVASLLSGHAYDDVERHGDDPVGDPSAWEVFADYPRITLHRILSEVEPATEDDWWGDVETLSSVPPRPDDFDWALAGTCLFQDTDILSLFNASLDGIESPDSELNWDMRIGDYRPVAWFKPFDNLEARDGRRPFRR